jgi:Protein of unknown function (DUF2911)
VKISHVTAVTAVAYLLLLPLATHGQVRGSERSTVSQISDGTKVTIDYARPHARGRTPVFGGLVPWGHTWTPGANEATTLHVSNGIVLNDVDVPEGRYSVWMIPTEGIWEIVLDPNDLLYHTQPPGPRPEQIRFEVSPEEVAFTEALTWDFPQVDREGMALRFSWGTQSVPFRIEVQSTAVTTVSAEAVDAIVGRYEMMFEGPPPPEAPAGTVSPVMMVELRYEDDQLLGSVTGAPPGLPSEFALLPVAQNVFNPAWLMDGEIFETEVDMFFEFDVQNGQATGYDVRGLGDRLMMRAVRGR